MAWQNEKPSALQNLKAEIKEKQLQRLYLLHGEETFLMNHYLQQIKKLLVDDLTESFNFHRLNNENFDILSFADAVENLPMMAETTMVQVDDVDIFKLNESDREKLAEVLSDIPEYCTVVFTFVTVAWKPDKRLKKLWSAVEEHGTVVEFEKQNQRDLIAWITRHFLANQKRISGELCAYLIEITDGTMTSISAEIKKICAYSGADVIKKSDIDAVTEPVLDAIVYQMTDAMGRGEYALALDKLQVLLKMQEEPIAILASIGSHFRKLSAARVLLDNGGGLGDLMDLYGMKEFPAKKAMDAARKFSQGFYAKASQHILETDRAMKSSRDSNQRLLELLILRLAQEERNG